MALGIKEAACPEMAGEKPGHCAKCGKPVTGRRRNWCSDECVNFWFQNHWMNSARRAMISRQTVYALEPGRERYHWVTSGVAVQTVGVPVGIACEGCGAVVPVGGTPVEVDHIERAMGRHGEASCVHHMRNLRVLCVPCHRANTKRQAGEDGLRRREENKRRKGFLPMPMEVA